MRVHRISWIAFSFAALAALAAGDEARCEVPRGRFTNAINLGSTVNSVAADNAPEISADGLTLYFNSTRSGGVGAYDLYQATRATVNDPFGDVMNLGPGINSSAIDGSSVISFDGFTLYFVSYRSGGEGGQDIYQARRPTVNDPFGDVMNLGAINTVFDERPGHISPDGLTLYFDSNRSGGEGNMDLYMATREKLSDPFTNVTNLGSEINGPTNEVGASVSTDGLTMFFSDRFSAPFRPGGQGDPDLWVAVRNSTDDPFGDVVNLDSFSLGSDVNTPYNEWNPLISDDWPAFGSQLYFQSTRPGSRGLDLWQATWVPEPRGDFNSDHVLDVADIDLLSVAVRSGGDDIKFDVNGDRVVDDGDRVAWIHDLKNTYFGDANLDGQFNSGDLVTVLGAGEFSDNTALNSGWAEGDFNGDGDVTSSDFVTALADGGFDQGPRVDVNAVPEPTSFLMLMAGLIGIAIRRRRQTLRAGCLVIRM